MILKVRCLVLILIFVPSLFADNSPTISKWQYYNEYAQKDNVFHYDNYSYSGNHESKFPIYLKEFLYASLGSIVFSVIPFRIFAGAAYGTCEAAKEIDPDGNFWNSCFGAFCGLSAGVGLGYGTGIIIDKVFHNKDLYWSIIPLGFLGNSIGAVIGYNLSLPKVSGYGFLHRHFELPSFSMKTEKTQEGKTITAVDFRLINARS